MKPKRSTVYTTTYTSILIEENEWEKLLSHVTKQPNRILQYYRDLMPHYPNQVYELFAKVILHESVRAGSREHYQQVCSHLKLLGKIGAKQLALDLTNELLDKYPRKPAFRDELLKVRK